MKLSVADEVWIGTALLHKEHPDRVDFDNQEIIERIRKESLPHSNRPGLLTHISSHAVANKAPQPGKHRILVETARGRRRLFRSGDVAHQDRTGKIVPEKGEIPSKYHPLLTWYQSWSASTERQGRPESALAKLAGRVRGIWNEDPVRYQRKLRGYE